MPLVITGSGPVMTRAGVDRAEGCADRAEGCADAAWPASYPRGALGGVMLGILGDATPDDPSHNILDIMDNAPTPTGHGQTLRASSQRYCHRGHLKDLVSRTGKLDCRICNKLALDKRMEALRQKRLRARHKKIKARVKPPRGERAWAAGHFEGEGTVTILSGGSKTISLPRVSLTSTDRAVIDYFQARWPGRLRTYIPKSKNGCAREACQWILDTGDAIEGFLLDMLPDLKTDRVRTKADLLIEDVRARAEKRLTEAAREDKRQRMAKMRALNRRGTARP